MKSHSVALSAALSAMNAAPNLVIVIPCYNEEEVLPETVNCLSQKIKQLVTKNKISETSSLLFVDDGSTDSTWSLIEKYQCENPGLYKGIRLPANEGHQKAILKGLLAAKDCAADIIVSIDADLQDDANAIEKMTELYLSGNEIVYGVRKSRKADGIFKRTGTFLFYCVMKLLGANLIYNHADFRLMSKNAAEALAEYIVNTKDAADHAFLRGIVPAFGFKSAAVYYDRKKRISGKSKYSLKKMVKLAFYGLWSYFTILKNHAKIKNETNI